MAEPTTAARADDDTTADRFAARLGLPVLHLEVVDVRPLTPTVRRLRFAGPQLVGFQHEAGQDLMFSIPADGRIVRRRYSIRAVDPVTGTADVDIVVHGDGPGARWTAAARVGDRIDAIGPRGKVVLDRDVAWHLFAGDESFLPAAAAMVEALPASSRALVVFEVEDEREQLPFASAAPVEVVWAHRAGGRRDDGLATAVDGVALPDRPGHAYVGGELHSVQAVVAGLGARGLAPEHISGKAYWRMRTPNAEHGEPPRD
jgi:NADPH-dependent ferric siderophore reductase